MKTSTGYFQLELELTKKHFDLEEVLDFSLKHDIQVLRGKDHLYCCYIDKVCHATAFTPVFAIVEAIESFKENN